MLRLSYEKRVFTVVMIMIAAFAISGIFTGCSPKKSEEGNADNVSSVNQQTLSTASPNEEKKPYNIKMWMFPLGDSNKQNEMFEGIVKQFQNQNPDISVNIQTMPWSNREQKLMTALAANRGPDIMYMNTDILLQFASNNMIIPLDKYVTDEQKNDFYDFTLKVNSYDGKIYGIPVLQEMMGYFYNLDILKDIGMTKDNLPSTFDEYEAMLKNLKEKGKYGTFIDVSGSLVTNGFYAQLWSEGGMPLAMDGKVTINNDAGKKVLDRFTKWYQEGYMPKDTITMTEYATGKFISGETASCYLSAMTLVNDDFKKVNFNWAIGPQLKGSAGAKTHSAIGTFCITKDSKDPDSTYKWIEYVTNKESLAAINKFAGCLAPRKSVPNMHADVKGYDVIMSQLDSAYSVASHPAERQIMPILIPEIQAAMLGRKTSEQALNDAAKGAEEVIKKFEDIRSAQQ
ncbi:MAG: sugar ABC transporter substrate-binding protein [Clostridiaceae bacterium]